VDRTTALHEHLREASLDVCWGQWTVSGVAGVRESSEALVDPEALLLASLSLARYDARLFDEIMDWLAQYSRLLDLARLRRLSNRAPEPEGRILRIAARLVDAQGGGAANLVRRFADDQAPEVESNAGDHEALFFSQSGLGGLWGEHDPLFSAGGFLRPPIQLRGLSGRPKMANQACLRFRMRGLIGVGSRAEVLTYLLTHDWTHGRLVAERCAYGQAPVASYLADLFEARLVDRRREGRKTLYRASDLLRRVFPAVPLYVDWIRVWPAITALLGCLRAAPMTEEARWIGLAQALSKHEPALRTEGFEVEIGGLQGWAVHGPGVLEEAVERVAARLEALAL
jgi:DNA-binding transcriptional ArsR family regulator